MSYAATYEDVLAAAARIRGLAHRTPVMTCEALDALAGRKIFLKCENLQKVGAFKFRGASHAVSRLGDEEARRGVVTHSSGNHAQALALAARLRGIPAWIVMPTDAPGVKRRAVEGYGATVVPCVPTLAARESTAAEVVARTGATLIPPYNHPDIIAGQGTAALELLEEVPGLDVVIAPVGGGGLMSGTCVATRGRSPQTRLFGAEPAGADDAARSLAAGQLLPQTGPKTIADGLKTGLGDLTWPILRDHLEGIVTVSEEEIIAATRLLWERAKLVVEPSGAVPLAALLGSRRGVFGEAKRVGVIVSGGNLDLDQLPWQR
jgi:threonine dehydratase